MARALGSATAFNAGRGGGDERNRDQKTAKQPVRRRASLTPGLPVCTSSIHPPAMLAPSDAGEGAAEQPAATQARASAEPRAASGHTPGGLPEPPNVLGMLWRGVVAGAKSLGVPVYDDDLPQSDEERQALYGAALEQARGEDFAEFEEAHIMHVAGTDKRGNRLVVVTGANLPAWGALDKERFRRYVYSTLHGVATQEAYCIVYLHTDMQASHRPCASWLMNSFEVLPDVWQERLHGFYVVHPAMTLRAALSILPFWLFSPFARGDFVQKVIYIDRIEQLWEDMDQGALQLPTTVLEHDAELEEKGVGFNYGVVPPPEELRAQHDAMMGGPAPSE